MLGFIATEIGYVLLGLFFTIVFPFINYSAPANSLIGRIKFPISVYSFIIGFLYLISVYFISRRKLIGLKLAIVVNTMGVFLIMPIVIGLMSFYYFTRPKVKEQFK
ncbi:MAG: hypothetical protein NTV24_03510 [Candidatus Woesebacteria bacterium]|nr:hypothetical protein [Candidatus Woesebacteria bacterium]